MHEQDGDNAARQIPAPRAGRAIVLLGVKRADNAQVRALAQRLGLVTQEIALQFNPLHLLPNWWLPTAPCTLTRANRATLAAAPPADLILAIGKRSYRAALALKRASGGRACWVHLGRPWGALAPIDLVITTAQYGLPTRPNILCLPAPIATIDLNPTPATSARPLLAVLIGGNSSTHSLSAARGAVLLRAAQRQARTLNADLVLVTSRRTPAAVQRLVAAARSPTIAVQAWPDPQADYRGVLRRASAFIVTTDSASMLTETLLTGKPVFAFAAAARRSHRLLSAAAHLLALVLGPRCWSALCDLCLQRGWLTPVRDMDALVTALRPFGLHDLEDDLTAARSAPTDVLPVGLELAAAAVERLLERHGARPRGPC